MGDDRQVQQRRWIIGFGFERRAKIANGFIGATALMRADAAESIEGFGILRAETKRVLKSFFRRSDFIYAQLSGAKFEQRVKRVSAAKGVGDEFGFCGVIFLLLEIEGPKVVMGFAEVVVHKEGAAVSLFGFSELAEVMISETEVIPCLSVGGNESCG